MKFFSALLSTILLLTACTTMPPGKVYRGSYFQNFESSSFTLEGSDQPWCVNATEMAKAQPMESGSSTADVIVRGELSPEGKYCNLGAYKYILKVYEVIEVSNLRSEN